LFFKCSILFFFKLFFLPIIICFVFSWFICSPTFLVVFSIFEKLLLFPCYSIENVKYVREIFWMLYWWNKLKCRYQLGRKWFFWICCCCSWNNSSLKLKYLSFEMLMTGKKWTQKCARKNFWKKVAWRTWCIGR
jgi:hypothetical protein